LGGRGRWRRVFELESQAQLLRVEMGRSLLQALFAAFVPLESPGT
jgi:hypothetical protein